MDNLEIKEVVEGLTTAVTDFRNTQGRRIEDLLADAKENKARLDQLETMARRPGSGGTEVKSADELEYKRRFDVFMRKGDTDGLLELEKKTMRTSSDPDGGYLATPDVEAGVIERVRETSPMRTIAGQRDVGGDAWEQVRQTGHASGGGWVGEQTSRTATDTPTFGKISIPAMEHFEMPPVTQRMLDDANFDVEGWLAEEISLGMSLRENTSFLAGDGVAKPRGILTYTAGADDTAFQVEQVNMGHATQLTSDGLIELQDSLFEPFQPGAVWLMRRATRTACKQLKDGQGQYLLIRDFSQGGALRLLGKPVVLCSDMPAIAGSALPIAYGDFRRGYLIVDKVGTRVLRDPYTSKGNVLFYTTKRVGGGVIRPQALKIGKVAA